MKTHLIKLFTDLDKKANEFSNKYMAYNGENYDADYYLFLGKACAFGEAADEMEKLINQLEN